MIHLPSDGEEAQTRADHEGEERPDKVIQVKREERQRFKTRNKKIKMWVVEWRNSSEVMRQKGEERRRGKILFIFEFLGYLRESSFIFFRIFRLLIRMIELAKSFEFIA